MQNPTDRLSPWPHAALSLFIFVLMVLGLGYRSLSQDETETAERGRTVWESGFPRVIDAAGNVSVFAGGREIEDGVAHRYTPWVQFYGAAAGVGLGRLTPIPKDTAVRIPFVTAHALTTGLMSLGLAAFAPVSVPSAVAISFLYAIQTDRLLHNRTARYHAFLDLLTLIGVLGCAGLRTNKKWAAPCVIAAIFLLPQTHTISGSLLSLFLAIQAGALLIHEPRKIFLYCFLPGLITLLLLIVLVRPWDQTEWGKNGPLNFMHSYMIHRRFVYSYIYMGIGGLFLWIHRRKWPGAALLACFFLLLVICPLLDRNQNSQFRYYLPVWMFGLLWPISMGFDGFPATLSKVLTAVLFLLVVLPEFSTRKFHPYHGLELVVDDFHKARLGVKQPLHEIIDIINNEGQKSDAILFDSVPMYANWYFPGHPIALMPDESGRRRLNQSNPIWDKPMVMPEWHVWLPNWRSGVAGIIKSDYEAHDLNMTKGRYQLTSKKLRQTVDMCIEKYWKTNMFNNNALYLYNDLSLLPTGGDKDVLVLARRCGVR